MRMEKETGDDSSFILQAYYDRTVRQTVVFDESRDTGDVEAQWNFKKWEDHNIALGAGYRVSADDIGNLTIGVVPQNRITHLFSTFIQDDIEIIEDRTRLSLGTKLEHNQFTGFEVQPGARLSHSLSENRVVWASVTRAVRTPSRVEDDVRLGTAVPVGGGFFTPATIFGSRAIESEDLLAWEIGHRSVPMENVTLELAAFYNTYSDLRTIETTSAAPPVTFAGSNNGEGEAWGFEIAPTIKLTDWWQLRPSYAFLQVDLRLDPTSNDPITAREEDQSPDHTVTINSRMNLANNLELDITGRYVDQIFVPRANFGAGAAIDAYWAMDVRIGWNPKPGLQFSLLGQGLLAPSRQEFAPTFVSTRTAESEQSIFGMMTYEF